MDYLGTFNKRGNEYKYAIDNYISKKRHVRENFIDKSYRKYTNSK